MMEEGFGSRKVLDKVVGAEYVEVMFAKSIEEAKACCTLLEEENIPARYEKSDESADGGIAILVPEANFVDATEILSSRTQEDVTEEDDEDLDVADELEDIDDVDEDEEFEEDDDDDDDADDEADDDDDEDTEEEDDY